MQRLGIAALDSIDDGIIVRDFASGQEWLNTSARRFEHPRHEDAIARDAIEAVIEMAKGGEPAERVVDLVGPRPRVLAIAADPLRVGDRVAGSCVVIRDITAATRLEAVRKDFVANVSHELKTPIGAVSLLLEVLAAESDPAEMKQLADRALQEIQRLTAIVEDLLDLSRIEVDGAISEAFEPAIDLGEVLGEAVVRFGAGADRLDIEASSGGQIAGNRVQLVSAVTNLLDNALKYSPEHERVDVRYGGDASEAWIEISDRGIGIPFRDRERVFERFYRVDRARSRGTGGTGLGLAIVRNVVQAHGGAVDLQSTEGDGTKITLTFPKEHRG